MDVCFSIYNKCSIEEQRQDRAEDVPEDDSEQDRCGRLDALREMLEYDDEDQYRKTYKQVGRRAEVLVVVSSAE